jgi:hypothetical protein
MGVKIRGVRASAGDFSPERDWVFTPGVTSSVKLPALGFAVNLTAMGHSLPGGCLGGKATSCKWLSVYTIQKVTS